MARSRASDEFTKPTGTVIGKGFTINAANFACQDSESMRVDGTIIGDIEMDGVLNISELGCVEGSISADSVRVAGRVIGNVHCRNVLHLTASADVIGDVRTSNFIVDDGAVLLGSCHTNISVEGGHIGVASS